MNFSHFYSFLGSEYISSEESDDDFKRNEEEVNENALKIEEGLISSGEFVDKKEETIEEKEGGMTISKENNFAAKKNKFGMLVIEEGDEGVLVKTTKNSLLPQPNEKIYIRTMITPKR